MNTQYYMPVKIIAGQDCIRTNGALLKALGNKAVIVTGTRSAKANGSLADITAALAANGQTYFLYDRVMCNPTVDCVYEGARAARENGADFVIACGGGSPMDAGKAIALLACSDIPRERIFTAPDARQALPIAVVPTTAGTGSETTQYSILTNDMRQTKTSVASPLLFPQLAFLDGKYMANLSVKTTVHTAVDALSHLVEGYLSNKACFASDALALQGMELLAGEFDNLCHFTLAAADRERLLYASCIGGMVIAQTGTTAVHSMGYPLTYFKQVDHGRANGLLLAEFLRFAQPALPQRITAVLHALRLPSLDSLAAVLDALLSCCARERLTPAEAEQYAAIAIQAKNIGNCAAVPTQEDLQRIYCSVFAV